MALKQKERDFLTTLDELIFLSLHPISFNYTPIISTIAILSFIKMTFKLSIQKIIWNKIYEISKT